MPACSISYPEPSNFLWRMLDKNEGLWTGSNSPQIADLLYCISDNKSGSPKNWSCPEPSFSSSIRRKKLAGSGNEIAACLYGCVTHLADLSMSGIVGTKNKLPASPKRTLATQTNHTFLEKKAEVPALKIYVLHTCYTCSKAVLSIMICSGMLDMYHSEPFVETTEHIRTMIDFSRSNQTVRNRTRVITVKNLKLIFHNK